MGELIRIRKDKRKDQKMPFIFGEMIKKKFAKNQNFLCAICGPTGSGKSLAAIRVAELVDKNFTSKNIVFTPKEFISLVRGKRLKTGSIIVFDESGVGINRRNWYSEYNKMMNFVLQTFRYKRVGVFFTLPDLSFMDKAAVRLLHCYLQTNPNKINRKDKTNTVRVQWVNPDPKRDKIYWPHPRVQINDETFVMNQIKVRLPSKQLLKDYDAVKRKYAEGLYVSYFDSFADDDGVTKNKLNKTQESVLEYLNKGLSNKEIAERLGMNSASYISNVKKAIIKKGFRWKTKAELAKERLKK